MQTTEPTGRPHRNHGLFPDHYLNVTLPGRPDWQALAGESRETLEDILAAQIAWKMERERV